jgi:tetratricopeptide (TPR) repeat protein
LFLPLFSVAQQPARITEETRQILTYGFNDPNPVAINSKTTKIYPYFLFEGYSKEGKMQPWKVIKLENDYIEVYVLPQVGGKIWGAIEKSTGKEFVYRNEVLKFRNIAMRGPWTSGGIEFNFGLIGHNPSTATPVDYTTRTNEDGSVSCFVGNIDLPSRTNWCVEIRLAKGNAYVETRALWSNPTPLNQSYYNWMTAAAVVSDDLEFYYPGKIALSHGGAPSPWPVDAEGHNMAMYKENAFGSHKSLHTVGVYKNFMGGYYHKSKFGFGHWALYDEMPGHKLWLWALSRNGAIWEDLLTDTDGQYLEYQAGRTFNQYDPPSKIKTSITQLPFSPHTTDRWTEIWFPFKDIGGIKEVSSYGVLNAVNENGRLAIGINSLTVADATIEITSRGKVLFTERKKFKPMEVFTTAIPLDSAEPYVVSVSGMNLSLRSDDDKLLKRPFTEKVRSKQLTNEALFNEALEQKEYREHSTAKQMFGKCMKNDSLHLGTLTNLAELLYRSSEFDSALWYANRVLRQDAYDAGANYIAGIAYKAKEDFTNALEAFGWAARAPGYRSAAYAEMASVTLQQGNPTLAEHYATLSLDYDRYNFTALHLLSVVARKMDNPVRAIELLKMIGDLDALDHFAQYEKYLLTKSQEDFAKFSSTITNEFPYQSYLEIALEYFSHGLRAEALDVLDHASNHPEIQIWKAYLLESPADLGAVAGASPAFVFPYRQETLRALKWAVSQNDNWKFKYYLALNLQAVQQTDAASQIFRALGQTPDYAPFYQTRARFLNDTTELADLERANQLAPDQWRTWHDLVASHERKNHDAKALAISTKATKLFKDDYTIRFQYAKALLNAGKYPQSIAVLKALDILPFEGSAEGHVVYEEAMLSQALVWLEKKKYDKALTLIRLSREWPENLGVGKPYDPDERIQDYLEAFVLGQTGKTAEANMLRRKVADYSKSMNAGSPLNNVFTYLVLKEEGKVEAADRYLAELKSMSEGNSAIQWVISISEHGRSVVKTQETGSDRYKTIILNAISLAGKP